MKKKIIQVLSQSGFFDKKSALIALSEGRIQVNQKTISSPAYYVDSKKAAIFLDGQLLKLVREKIYLMMNKPAGLLCQKSPQGQSVYEVLQVQTVLPEKLKKTLFAVGRLDQDSTGLLLFTNDGLWAHQILDPKQQIEKEYQARMEGKLTPENIQRLETGVEIPSGEDQRTIYKTQPCRIFKTTQEGHLSACHIVIQEGKKRQIRLMLEEVGCRVTGLKRIRIGGLWLRNLREGGCRVLEEEERGLVFNNKGAGDA